MGDGFSHAWKRHAAKKQKLPVNHKNQPTPALDKPDITLIEPEFLRGIARVMQDGLNRPGRERDSWKNIEGKYGEVRAASALRHLLDMVDGELLDKDSGLLNAYHLAANAMIIAHYHRKELENGS
jgi:hypothetical protein